MKNWYQQLSAFEDKFQSPFLLLIRLFWGYQFILAGMGKLLNGMEVAPFFGDLGIPFPVFSTYLVGFVEAFGGLCFILGFLVRIVTIPLIITMFVALFLAHDKGLATFFSKPDVLLAEAPVLFIYTSFVLLFFGAGKYSLDYLFFKKEN